MTIPPSAGPATKLVWNIAMLSESAPASRPGETRLGTIAVRVGESSAATDEAIATTANTNTTGG